MTTTTQVATAADYLRATATNTDAARPVDCDPVTRIFFCHAFEAAVRRRFPRGTPVADLARSVGTAARRHKLVSMPPMDVEMLVRDALGEAVPIEDIAPQTVVTAYVVMFAALADEMALTDTEIDDLIREAEKRGQF